MYSIFIKRSAAPFFGFDGHHEMILTWIKRISELIISEKLSTSSWQPIDFSLALRLAADCSRNLNRLRSALGKAR